MKIADEHIQNLRAHGLFVSEPQLPGRFRADGVLVGKPTTVVGNKIANYSTGYLLNFEKREEVKFDAPPLWLFEHGSSWIVEIQSYTTNPPEYIVDEWMTPREAIEDILDFFFGDPKRMEAIAETEAAAPKRRQASDQK
jgi:hypothetical protein